MWILEHIPNTRRFRALSPERLRRRAPLYAIAALYLYVGFHALSGSQGLVRWIEFEDRADRLEAKLLAVQDRRAMLQDDVDRLSARSLDLDTLDIEARKTLYVAADGEITIWLDQTNP